MSEPEKSRDIRPLVTVLPFLLRYRPLLGGWLAFLLLSSVATLVLPYAVREMIDHGFSAANAEAIDRYFLGLIAVAIVLALATAMRYFFISLLGERVVADLRSTLYAHLLRLDLSFFESNRTGELLSRLGTDTELVQTVVGSSASVAVRSIVTLVGATILWGSRWWCCRCCCSAGAYASSRAPARTESPMPAPRPPRS